jgi:hypothetical protein
MSLKFDKPKNLPQRKRKKNRVRKKITVSKRKLTLLKDAEVRAEVFERDGNKCVRCQRTDTLAPSHVYPKGKYPRLRFMVINILTMCYGCHIHWWHKNPIEASEWFLKSFPDRARQLSFLKDTAPKVEL